VTKLRPKLAPREAPDKVALEAFVRGQIPQAPQATEQSPPKPVLQESEDTGRKVLHRKDGRARVRTTVYLTPELARALAVRSAETGADQSEIMGTALESYLRRV
jgi:hypothetical protein